jgi:hypothetical protein
MNQQLLYSHKEEDAVSDSELLYAVPFDVQVKNLAEQQVGFFVAIVFVVISCRVLYRMHVHLTFKVVSTVR